MGYTIIRFNKIYIQILTLKIQLRRFIGTNEFITEESHLIIHQFVGKLLLKKTQKKFYLRILQVIGFTYDPLDGTKDFIQKTGE